MSSVDIASTSISLKNRLYYIFYLSARWKEHCSYSFQTHVLLNTAFQRSGSVIKLQLCFCSFAQAANQCRAQSIKRLSKTSTLYSYEIRRNIWFGSLPISSFKIHKVGYKVIRCKQASNVSLEIIYNTIFQG